MRSRCEGGWECGRQTWWASVAEWRLWVGRLHISQSSCGCGCGCDGFDSGGAECVRSGDGLWVGVLGVVFGFITIERYLSAMLAPEVEVEVGGVVVSRSEERTKGTRLRRMPEVKGRCCSGGR